MSSILSRALEAARELKVPVGCGSARERFFDYAQNDERVAVAGAHLVCLICMKKHHCARQRCFG